MAETGSERCCSMAVVALYQRCETALKPETGAVKGTNSAHKEEGDTDETETLLIIITLGLHKGLNTFIIINIIILANNTCHHLVYIFFTYFFCLLSVSTI